MTASQSPKVDKQGRPRPPKKAKKRWRRWRHGLVRYIAYAILYPFARLKYGVRVEKFKSLDDRAYLILYNHQTLFDQFFVGMAFPRTIYYLASEDLFSNGLLSRLIRFLVAPIPIKKQATDIGAIRSCLQVAREGGTIAIAPEGNRTYSGRTEHMSPSIAPLARRLGLPIALLRIEGGYGVHPRWSNVVRRGGMRVYVSQVIEPTDYAELSDDQLFSAIRDGLYVNEAADGNRFAHPRRAEYLERLLYVCPFCGLSRFESRGAHLDCLTCGRRFVYGEDLRLSGVGFTSPFPFVVDWYDYQTSFMAQLDLTAYKDSPLYRDSARLSRVELGKRKVLLRKEAQLCLYGDRITVDEAREHGLALAFEDIRAIAVLGRNKLNIYHRDQLYQLKGDKRFNAVKYVNTFYRHKNQMQGDNDGKFLGL